MKDLKSILSGILISIGAFAYLKVGGIIGAILFSFGIISIVGLKIKLYTGVAGTDEKFVDKLGVLALNILGAAIGSLIILFGDSSVHEIAQNIVLSKLLSSPFQSFCRAVMCGLIVDVSVHMSKKYNFLPLLIGIPTFIMCGFNHSIADAAYFVFGGIPNNLIKESFFYYFLCIVGNYLGCNFRRIFKINLLT